MKEKEAIAKLQNGKKKDLITLIRTFKKEGIENFVVTRKEIAETVLQLIEKQKEEIEQLKKRIPSIENGTYFGDFEGLLKLEKELQKKDERILDLEFVLMDMVLQFADENKEKIGTMGLSALELAFNELDFDNPMSIKEVHKRYKKLAQEYYK